MICGTVHLCLFFFWPYQHGWKASSLALLVIYILLLYVNQTNLRPQIHEDQVLLSVKINTSLYTYTVYCIMLVVLYVYHAFITYTFMQIGLDGECDRLEYTRLMLPFLDCQIVSPVSITNKKCELSSSFKLHL
jgi:peptidoglycan biosynthesis protein MviN/MurJ (putative lipid II flippase)